MAVEHNVIVMSGIVPALVGAKKWKPDKEELERELKKMGIPKEEFKLSKLANEILLDPANPVENVGKICEFLQWRV